MKEIKAEEVKEVEVTTEENTETEVATEEVKESKLKAFGTKKVILFLESHRMI